MLGYQDDRLQVDRLQVEYWQRCGEKAIRVHYWWDCKLVQSLWRTTSRFLKKLKMKLPYDPAVPLLGIYPKEMKTNYQREICTPTVSCSNLHLSQDMETMEVYQQTSG